jgi:hypothetical protein
MRFSSLRNTDFQIPEEPQNQVGESYLQPADENQGKSCFPGRLLRMLSSSDPAEKSHTQTQYRFQIPRTTFHGSLSDHRQWQSSVSLPLLALGSNSLSHSLHHESTHPCFIPRSSRLGRIFRQEQFKPTKPIASHTLLNRFNRNLRKHSRSKQSINKQSINLSVKPYSAAVQNRSTVRANLANYHRKSKTFKENPMWDRAEEFALSRNHAIDRWDHLKAIEILSSQQHNCIWFFTTQINFSEGCGQ